MAGSPTWAGPTISGRAPSIRSTGPSPGTVRITYLISPTAPMWPAPWHTGNLAQPHRLRSAQSHLYQLRQHGGRQPGGPARAIVGAAGSVDAGPRQTQPYLRRGIPPPSVEPDHRYVRPCLPRTSVNA